MPEPSTLNDAFVDGLSDEQVDLVGADRTASTSSAGRKTSRQ
jgi:hypothetical protein